MPMKNYESSGDREIITKTLKLDHESLGGNYWLSKAVMIIGYTVPSVASILGFMYSCGGTDGSGAPVANVTRYDDSSDSWLAMKNLTTTMGLGGAFSLSSLYNFHGLTTSSTASVTSITDAYNESTNTWASRTAAATAKRNIASFALNGYGYCFGGFTSSAYNSQNQRYDEILNAWVTKTSYPVTTDGHGGFSFRLFGIGAQGRASGTPTLNSYMYNDVVNTWTAISSTIGSGRAFVAGFMSNDLGHVVDGWTGSSVVSSTNQLDPISKIWTVRANEILARSQVSGNELNGDGYVIGGNNSVSNTAYNNVSLYHNYHLYTITKNLNKSSRIPRSISTAVFLGKEPLNIPINIRTDGVNWRHQISGKRSIRSNETTKIAYSSSTNGIKVYEIQVGLPKSISGFGGGYWQSRASSAARSRNAGISLNGFGYSVAGVNASNVRVNIVEQYNDYSNTWTSRAAISSVRQGPMGFSLNGLGYSCCGSVANDSVSAVVDRYNDETNSWSVITSTNVARQVGASYDLSGFGYVVCGSPIDSGGATSSNSTTNEQYNDSSNAWAVKAAMTVSRRFPVAFGANQLGYVCTGIYDAGTRTNANEQYNDAADAWVTRAPALIATFGCMGFVIKNQGYLSYGNPSSLSVDLQNYNDALDLWHIKTSANGVARNQGAGMSLRDAGYASGGFDSAATGNLNQYISISESINLKIIIDISSDELIIPTGGTWSIRAVNPASRLGTTSFTINNKSLCALGHTNIDATNRADLFNDTLNSWSATGSIATARRYASGFITDGYGFVSGGRLFNATTGIFTHDRYDPVLGTWTNKTGMPGARFSAAGFGLDYFGYVTCGNESNAVPERQTTFRYDNQANTWISKADTPTGLQAHSSFVIAGVGYITHGNGPVGNTGNTHAYNETLDSWTDVAPGSVPRSSAAGFEINGSGFTVCGSAASLSAVTDEYLSHANLWMIRTSAGLARTLPSSSGIGASGFVTCGATTSNIDTQTDRNERYTI